MCESHKRLMHPPVDTSLYGMNNINIYTSLHFTVVAPSASLIIHLEWFVATPVRTSGTVFCCVTPVGHSTISAQVGSNDQPAWLASEVHSLRRLLRNALQGIRTRQVSASYTVLCIHLCNTRPWIKYFQTNYIISFFKSFVLLCIW